MCIRDRLWVGCCAKWAKDVAWSFCVSFCAIMLKKCHAPCCATPLRRCLRGSENNGWHDLKDNLRSRISFVFLLMFSH